MKYDGKEEINSLKNTDIKKTRGTKEIVNVASIILVLISTIISTLYLVHTTFLKSKDDGSRTQEHFTIDDPEGLQISIVERIKQIIIDLDRARNVRDFKMYASFFAESVDRFYLKINVSNSEIENDLRWYLSKRYPQSVVELELDSLTIASLNDDESNIVGYQVMIFAKHTRKPSETIEYFTIIKFNKSLKIFSIQDFIPSTNVNEK